MGKKKSRNTLTYDTLSALFTGICDAIRFKTGGSDLINHQDIPDVITNLPTGGGSSEVLDRFSGNFYLPSAGEWRPHTMTKAGYISLMFICTYSGITVSIRKNGSSVGGTISINSGTNQAIGVSHFQVAVGDRIAIHKTSDANGPCQYLLVYEED